jgi:hypothetical protein
LIQRADKCVIGVRWRNLKGKVVEKPGPKEQEAEGTRDRRIEGLRQLGGAGVADILEPPSLAWECGMVAPELGEGDFDKRVLISCCFLRKDG